MQVCRRKKGTRPSSDQTAANLVLAPVTSKNLPRTRNSRNQYKATIGSDFASKQIDLRCRAVHSRSGIQPGKRGLRLWARFITAGRTSASFFTTLPDAHPSRGSRNDGANSRNSSGSHPMTFRISFWVTIGVKAPGRSRRRRPGSTRSTTGTCSSMRSRRRQA
jgi:hypothetical protein